jgi:hypothetical protein
MSFTIRFPKPLKIKVVVTDMMVEMINRTLAVHALSALIIWYGQSSVGKTTTARYMVDLINQQFDENDPNSFRAVYYEVGEILKGSGNEMKKGIRSMYQAVLQIQIDEGFYRSNPAETIAAQLVHGLRRKRIQLVIVDEAGCLSEAAIRGMTLVRDTAENEGFALTIVFVGMDDLPQKMTRLPEIHRRVKEVCYFSQYNLDETWALLKELHPYFAGLDGSKSSHREQVETIHEFCLGLPGLIVAFVQKLDYRLTNYKGEVNTKFLWAVYELTNKSMIVALNEARRPYQPYKTVRGGKKQEAAPKAHQAKRKGRRRKGSKKNVIPFKPGKAT